MILGYIRVTISATRQGIEENNDVDIDIPPILCAIMIIIIIKVRKLLMLFVVM